MSPRRPLLPMMASLAAHGGAVALLALASGESLPSGLFIVLSELEPAAIASGPRQARASAGPPATPAASPLGPRPSPLASAAAVAPLPAPGPTTPPEREVPPAPAPARDPEPVAAVSAIREEAATDAARSSANPSAVEGATGSDLARGGSASSDEGAGGGAAQQSASVRGDGVGGRGATVAVAPSGSGGGELGSEYGGYYARVRQRIQESLRYPSAAQRRGLKGTVLLEILIRPDGAIGAVSVTASSSHRLLDEAALETVRSLSPQPFPVNLKPRWLTVRLPVVFDLQ